MMSRAHRSPIGEWAWTVDRWLLEIPAGTCDVDGEPSETTARRELAEEVGLAADRLELLARIDEMLSLWWNACSSQQETDSFGTRRLS